MRIRATTRTAVTRWLIGPAAGLLLATGGHALPAVELPSHEPVRFIVTGDAGTGDPHLHNGIVALTKKGAIDGIILTGDNVYPCGVSSVQDPQWAKVTVNFADAGVPVYPVLGNHDYGDPSPHHRAHCGKPSAQAQIDATGHVPHWTFPARMYELRSPFVEIMMVDSQPIASAWTTPFLGSDTASSEVGRLEGALEEPFRGWKVVVGHQTIYSSGTHGNPPDLYTETYRAAMLPLFGRYGVQLYICGHDHDAELIGSGSGTEYLVAGNGAESERMRPRLTTSEPRTRFPRFPPAPLVGFTLLEIWRSHIVITFYDGEGVARTSGIAVRR